MYGSAFTQTLELVGFDAIDDDSIFGLCEMGNEFIASRYCRPFGGRKLVPEPG